MYERIKDILLESIQVKEEILRNQIGQIAGIAQLMIDCLKKDGKVIVFGNGGSASDSQHIAAELVGRFKKDRSALAAIALTTNTSILTSLANDYGYDVVFSRQVEALGKKNDVVLGISTSGKAKNVALGIKQAKKMGIKTVALSGGDGGDIVKLADVSLVVPSKITARIQEAHITIAHIICEMIEQELCQEQK
ncbi:MAG: D-sedoheptulose 7-phosphate isomerase [Candidatus Omnitrophica bacterium]|nr:D-sedoheptulose 7-phosphate isomerase [Candidatus Omnitrophota bacterium]MBU4302886.1 D-sedoheptulose 7-phosphate isomerase [Candidatus Omnitrophota bacterium]MBU4418851.1 D-sedoheptulose 7-phosphate isomerase [Candidatus Omnitrophota bacterium]MBU4468756.1 D-sedoheptulose 7-phosphate isomerase [Candidatus Omnitrophota bacterium]MCG2708248.1 D-sedoheptulose 7-phosphate isomerase [Candidatus Omnitrophota bacterium]